MTAIRFFTDEDVHSSLAVALRARGFEASSAPELSRRGESDESQLEFAAKSGFVIVTFNVADFANLHVAWCEQRRSHAGIVVSSQRPVGEILEPVS